LTVFSDVKIALDTNSNGIVDGFRVPIRNIADYSPFGVQLDGRTVQGDFYRYGYQGSEKDDESKGGGNSYTTFFRQLDPRVGRWLSLDPVFQPWQSPYCSMDNSPIRFSDQNGDVIVDKNGNEVKVTKETTSDNKIVLSYEFNPKLSFEERAKFINNQGELLTALAQTDAGQEQLNFILEVETKISISKIDLCDASHRKDFKKGLSLGKTGSRGKVSSKKFGTVPKKASIVLNDEMIDNFVNNPTDEVYDSNGNKIFGSNNRFNFIDRTEGLGTVLGHEILHIFNRFTHDKGFVKKGGNHTVKSGIPTFEINFMKQYRDKNKETIPLNRLDPTINDVNNAANSTKISN
jgi:RHS repeat-associated protein